MLNEGLETLGEDDEESRDESGAFEASGIKEVVLPGTLKTLGKNSFYDCKFLKKVWVEQRCRIRIKGYVKTKVDVRVFRAGDKIHLDSIQNNAGNGK